jgi:hypothetical protein
MVYLARETGCARTITTLAFVSCLACGGDDGLSGTSNADGIGSSSFSQGTLTSSEETSDSDDPTTTSSSGGDKLDLGDGESAGTAGDTSNPGAGCQKVDLLFVIDNSGSMADEQVSLVASFSGFVAGIKSALATADSYHIGVVTTDAYSSNEAGCQTLGALVTQTGGDSASNMNCLPFASGKRWLDDTEPDLDSKFACIAQVGVSGSGDEVQAQAGYTAVTLSMNQPGACNDGFIRPDALLVVVFITDEDDAPDCVPFFGCLGGSAGNPPDWAGQFSQAKNSINENIVMLALVGQSAQNSCGADHCQRLIALTNTFINGSSGDICAPSYATFFNDAISVIDNACDNFIPPG